ncbi:MAG: hypothetical protein N3I86_10495, partial [Verrucomicrobiae bacterium]|nr:hypothetical protein [Verrucomicrobiae bacterium]
TNVLSQAFINAAPAPTEPGRALDTARERRAPPADAASQVLTRFQLVQAGSQLQVVDADGSVYLADLADQTPVAASGETVAAAATEKAPVETARARRVGPSAARSTAPAAQAQAPPTRNVLRAVGTNRTLNQQVEFVWNFAPLTNGGLAARAQTASAPAAPVLQNVQLPLPPSVGIVGRARIGNTQEIEVRAVPQNSP